MYDYVSQILVGVAVLVFWRQAISRVTAERNIEVSEVVYGERIIEVSEVVYDERIIEVSEVECREIICYVPETLVQMGGKPVPKLRIHES